MISPDGIIYLDNNATTQLDPAVIEEMLPFITSYYGNASSGYRFGSQMRAAIDLARERVAGLLGCEAEEIVFTSGGTESNNAAINSALQSEPRGKHVVTTAVEHSATFRTCEQLVGRGCAVTFVGVNGDGNLDLDELENAIRPETVLVSAMWANNETGVLFPVERIAEIARRRRGTFHTRRRPGGGKSSTPSGRYTDQLLVAFRAQAPWPERSRCALRESPFSLPSVTFRRKPGEQPPSWHGERGRDRRFGESRGSCR